MKVSKFKFCLGLSIAFLLCISPASSIRLRQLNVNKDAITISGFSSGGTFAQMMHISYSSLFKGIAVFSNNFYRCGSGNGVVAEYSVVCTNRAGGLPVEQLYDPQNAVADIQSYFSSGMIEDPRNLANKPLYIFHGVGNPLFSTELALRTLNIFEPFINNHEVIRTRIQLAGQTLPSNRPGLPSCTAASPSLGVSNCGFSGALDGLQWLLGSQIIKSPYAGIKLQTLLQFNQTEFFADSEGITERNDLDDVGFIYVPKACHKKSSYCLLHVYFHGCRVGREFVGSGHIVASGFLEVAEANGIIMVFPQALSSTEQPDGCWDIFGITGSFYATQLGAQVSVVKRMIDRILGITEQDLIDQANGVIIEEPIGERPYHHSGGIPKPKYPGSEYPPPPYTPSAYPHSEYSHYPADSDLASRASYNSQPLSIKTPVVSVAATVAKVPLYQKPTTSAGLDYTSQNTHCTETRVSEDTILKRCTPTS